MKRHIYFRSFQIICKLNKIINITSVVFRDGLVSEYGHFAQGLMPTFRFQYRVPSSGLVTIWLESLLKTEGKARDLMLYSEWVLPPVLK